MTAAEPEAALDLTLVERYEQERSVLRWLFEEAEDSAAQLDGYLHLGEVLVPRRRAEILGHLQLVETAFEGEKAVERDAFVPATGYPDPIEIDGIELRDRVWLSRDL